MESGSAWTVTNNLPDELRPLATAEDFASDDDDSDEDQNDYLEEEGAASPGRPSGNAEEESLIGSSLAEMPTDLENCLALNRAYRALLESAIGELAERLEENRQLQKELPAQLSERSLRPPKPRVRKNWYHSLVFHHPYFRDINGMRAPMNEDEKAKRANKEMDPYLTPSMHWTSEENRMLVNAVKSNLLQQSLESLMDRKEALAQKILETEDADQIASITARMEQLDEQVAKTRDLGLEELLEQSTRPIDWLRIAAADMRSHRTAFDCEMRWRHLLDVRLNQSPWTPAEDERLKSLAAKWNERNWDQIAQEMKSGRSAFQCAQHYASHLVTRHNMGTFTEEENHRLQQLISVCTEGDDISWAQVSHFMGSRSKKQVMNRYNQSLHPSMQRDRWTAQEDIMLLVAVKLYGDSSWTKVAQDMPWRTANAALTRYRRLCETLRSKQKTMADLERSLPAPVAPVNAARCARLKGVDKQLDLYRRTSRLLNTQTMKRAALMLVKGRDESLDREMCLRLYHKMLRLLQRNHAPRNLQMQGRLLNKAISQYAQPLHRPMVPNLAAYERQEWHAVANVLHDLHGLPRPPPNPDVEEVGTVPVFEEFFSKEVLDVPEGFQSNDSSLVLPLLPPNEVGAGKDRLSDDTKSSCKSHEHKTWLQLAWLDCSARSQKTTVPTFGKLSDRFVNGNLTESLSALQDDNSFPELSAALDANSIEDIRCTECTSRSLLELSSIAARASQESCFRCSELRATRKNFEVLQARFVSYFFWPALLDTVNVAEMVELPSGTYEKGPKKYRKRSRIKRPWVKEMWKERKRLASAAAVAGAAAEGIDAPQEDCDGGPSGTSAMLA
ncbi:snRNA-activating protein complex subunit 4 isoform X1 [Rhipicephalus sanguineus]|uniref:snRNA-activating protein complex subunit 4 isoform X1 n=1 Tax=Rhipicephalus sanguineus TaxID=34632 RepID=UPI0020C36E30|nr:snRNA-activating protein complex subunit 4 isoform X1 [Rhipicephalus sanguineus]